MPNIDGEYLTAGALGLLLDADERQAVAFAGGFDAVALLIGRDEPPSLSAADAGHADDACRAGAAG